MLVSLPTTSFITLLKGSWQWLHTRLPTRT